MPESCWKQKRLEHPSGNAISWLYHKASMEVQIPCRRPTGNGKTFTSSISAAQKAQGQKQGAISSCSLKKYNTMKIGNKKIKIHHSILIATQLISLNFYRSNKGTKVKQISCGLKPQSLKTASSNEILGGKRVFENKCLQAPKLCFCSQPRDARHGWCLEQRKERENKSVGK